MSELEEALKFIEKIEIYNSGRSAYEIANKLRGYTKPEYTTEMWQLATGYQQKYINGTLNKEGLVLSRESIDFGHFIASLSDQIYQPGVNWSNLTSWTADHTSWAGDIGSAVIAYRSQFENIHIKSLDEALDKLTPNSDYTADIAAYVVGAMINWRQKPSISKAIIHYSTTSYAENVRTFIEKRFGGIIEGNKLKNPAEVDSEIRRSVSTYIRLYTQASDVFNSVKDILKLQPILEMENTLLPNGADILQGSLHFMSHIVKKGGLDTLKFKPYQLPGVPWLGPVNYEVSVPQESYKNNSFM